MLVWLGRHWGGCGVCLSPFVVAASAVGWGSWGQRFRDGTGQTGDPSSGMLQDTTAWGHCFRAQPHVTRGGWAGSTGTGDAGGGVTVPTPCQPPPAAQGPHAAACPGVHARNLGLQGGLAASVPSDPWMIQALFCFSSARRRGQPDGWRWLPRSDKTARLSRHNGSVRLLARPRGHGPGAGWVLVCPLELPQPCWGSPECSGSQQRGRDSHRSQVSRLIPLPAPALQQGDTAQCPGSLPCPLPSLLTIQKYLGRPQHKVPLVQGTFPRELLTFIHPSPTFLLTSGSFYPILHPLLTNFWDLNIQDASPCSTTPWHGCRTPLGSPSPNWMVFENSKASPIRSSRAAALWRGTGAVTVPP